MNTEELNRILDQYMLLFLDDYEAEFGQLPDEIQKNLWMRGFIDACHAIHEALSRKIT